MHGDFIGKGVAGVALVLAAGCASFGGTSAGDPPPPAPPAAIAAPEEAPRIGKLDRRALPDSACSMYLWTLDRDPELVFYTDEAGAARMAIDGVVTEFARSREAGPAFFGQRAEQEFQARSPAGDALVAAVTFAQGPRFSGGGYVQSGLIRLRGENGWERITPVVGVVGCRD